MADNVKVLVVDDDPAITEPLTTYLKWEGFDIAVAHDGIDALKQIKLYKPRVVILDIHIPPPNGLEVLRQLRAERSDVVVILLTNLHAGLPGLGERIYALAQGADDYLNKPYDQRELVARMRAILRRVDQHKPSLGLCNVLVSNDLAFHRPSRNVMLQGKLLKLGPKARALLEQLMLHPKQAITRARLLDEVWQDADVYDRVVDREIAEVRRELMDDSTNPRFIKTVPREGTSFSGGYMFIGDVECESDEP